MEIWSSVRGLFRKGKLDVEMSEEMRHHVGLQIERNVADGMSADEARYAALRQFGNVASVQERAREGRGWVWLEQTLQDIRYAFRGLCRSPGFTVIAVLSIAVGIGATTAIFSFVNGVLLKQLPYAEPDRIVVLFETAPGGGRAAGTSTLTYFDWEKQQKAFQNLAAANYGSVTFGGPQTPEPIRGAQITADYFNIFGMEIELGRKFTAGESVPGSDKVVVLGHSFWTSHFGADPGVIGRIITLDGEPYNVIGVLQANPLIERRFASVWRPLAIAPEKQTRNYHWLQVLARLKTGITLAQAREQMNAIGAQISNDFPESNRNWGVGVSPFGDEIVSDRLRQSLYILLAGVGTMLLIACVNLACLTLVRGLARRREVAVRAALGAGRGRLVRQLLTDSGIILIVGGLLAVPVGLATSAGLGRIVALPPEVNVTLDWRVMFFGTLLMAGAGLVSGLVPALQTSRVDLTNAIKHLAAGAGSRCSARRLRGTFVMVEVALSVVLLACAGLFVRSLWQLHNVNIGPEPDRVITAQVPIAEKWTGSPHKLNAHLQRIVERLRVLPGVQSVALGSGVPMRPTYGMPFQIADQDRTDRANRPGCFLKTVTPSYFSVLGLSLLKGRALNDRDAFESPRVLVINEVMARKYFPDVDPIGKRILIEEILLDKPGLGTDVSWEVVGVVANEQIGSLDIAPYEGVYLPSEQSPQVHQALLVRTSTDSALVQRAITNTVLEIDPDQQLTGMTTLDAIKNASMGDRRIYSLLLCIFAAVALLLAATGIYGVIAFSVAQRTREMSIRLAIGAERWQVRAMIMRQGAWLVGWGMVVGLCASVGLTHFLQSQLYQVSPQDPLVLVAVVGLLSGVALSACWLPAQRATKVDPVIALRAE